jgi:hypothetical protein
MPVANYALGVFGACAIECRTQSTTQPYFNKLNPVVRTFLSGFQVNSVGVADDYFGISLDPTGAGTTSFTMGVTIYGTGNLIYVSYFYLAYDSTAMNVLYSSTAMSGRNHLGCYYPNYICNISATSNTTFNTGATSVLAYTSSMFYMGIDIMIAKYSGTAAYRGEYDITGMSQNTDTTVKVNFAFSGNALGAFYVGYSYFTLQTFYCPPGGPDYYFVYNSNTCDSACNNSISQFMNASNVCAPCSAQCYKCVGT